MSRIGAQVKGMRTSKGLTQKQLGKMVGVTEKFIDEVETGKKVLSDDLIKRVSKALGQDINDLMAYEMQGDPEPEKITKSLNKPVLRTEKQEVQKVWHDALDSVLKAVPIYEYDLTKVIDTRPLPVISNKVEGYAKDKVLFLKILDNDMLGFRMMKGDIAFAHITHEVENNTICLVEVNGQRAIRQVKRLDGEKILLLSNKGTVSAETFPPKSVKILARLDRLEIKL